MHNLDKGNVEEKKLTITFKISNMEVKRFGLYLNEIQTLPDILTYDIATTVSFLTNEKQIKWDIVSKVFLEPEKKTLLSEINTSFTYDIINFTDIIRVSEDGKIESPDNLLKMLLQISLDCTRGIVFSKFTGTLLEKSYYPVVFSNKFVDQILGRV